MASGAKPSLWLIAGPNGVGKTTYAYRHIRSVSGSIHFVNLDEIARGVSPFDPDAARDAAARFALLRIRHFIASKRSFSIETTLAGRTHLGTVKLAASAGFDINLLYFILPSAEVCLARIARRVVEGGHDVPETDVRRRFARSIQNFTAYCSMADRWMVLDNSRAAPTTAAEGRRGCLAIERDVSALPSLLINAIHKLPPCPEAVVGSS
jgi:predicted ABC-type ATPase